MSIEAKAAYPLAEDSTLPPPSKHLLVEEEVQDEQALRNLKPNKPLELVP